MKCSTVFVGVSSVLVAFLLTSCATSPEDCDPNNNGVLKSLVCQNAYEERQKKLEREVREMAQATDEKKEEQKKLQQQLEEANELRLEVEGKSWEVEIEIARLWESNLIEESEYERLQAVLAARNTEVQEVAVELKRMEGEDADGIQDTISRLNKEKQEMEALLSDLAQ